MHRAYQLHGGTGNCAGGGSALLDLLLSPCQIESCPSAKYVLSPCLVPERHPLSGRLRFTCSGSGRAGGRPLAGVDIADLVEELLGGWRFLAVGRLGNAGVGPKGHVDLESVGGRGGNSDACDLGEHD